MEALLEAAIRLALPLLLAALGELIIERAGVITIGTEGMILCGAFAGFAVASATRSGSSRSSGPGMPVRTLQKAQARVQVSPMIMKVAWRFDQHSPILGQPASSQTVTRPCSRTIALVSR